MRSVPGAHVQVCPSVPDVVPAVGELSLVSVAAVAPDSDPLLDALADPSPQPATNRQANRPVVARSTGVRLARLTPVE